MEELKKGELLLKKTQQTYSFEVSVCDGMICDYCKEFYDYYKKLPENSRKILDDCFSNLKNKIQDSNTIEILSEYCKGIEIDTKSYPIIYKEYHDTKGNKYGEELLTGKSFPIPKEVHDNFTVTKMQRRDYLFHGGDGLNPHYIFHNYGRNNDGYYLFSDSEKHLFHSNTRRKQDSYTISNNSVFGIGTIVKAPVICYEITLSLDYIHDNANRLEVALEGHDYANQQEVNSYRARNIIVKHISRKIKKLFDLNTFKVSLPRMEKKDISTLLNQIETLLNKIKDINEDWYIEASNKYQSIIKGNNNDETDIFDELQEFYNDCSKKLTLPINPDEACEFLDAYINTVIDNNINNRFSNLTLEYLRGLYIDFLKKQNDYSVQTIQLLNKKFNLLWFLFLHINRLEYRYSGDFFRTMDSSLIEGNVNGIVNIIRTLSEKKIIDCPKYVNRYDEQKTFKDLLQLMSNIEIIQFERTKELIK